MVTSSPDYLVCLLTLSLFNQITQFFSQIFSIITKTFSTFSSLASVHLDLSSRPHCPHSSALVSYFDLRVAVQYVVKCYFRHCRCFHIYNKFVKQVVLLQPSLQISHFSNLSLKYVQSQCFPAYHRYLSARRD